MELLTAAAKQTFIAIVSLASVLTVFSYFGNYDPPVSFIRAQVSNPGSVHPGGILTIDWEVERSRRCYTQIDRHLVSSLGKRIELADTTREGGISVAHRDPFSTDVRMPVDMPYGKSKYVSTGLYSCNLWQRVKPIVVPAPEVDFVVTPGPGSPPPPNLMVDPSNSRG